MPFFLLYDLPCFPQTPLAQGPTAMYMSEAGGLNSFNIASLCLRILHFYEEKGFSLLLLKKHTRPCWAFIFLIDRDVTTKKHISTIEEKKVQAVLETYREWWGVGQTREHKPCLKKRLTLLRSI